MTKVTLNNVGSLIDATTAASTINNNFDTVETAFDNTLSRDGTSPNTMGATLDMNGHTILNLPAASATGEPVTYEVFEAALVGHGNLPLGGTTGQVLAKTSNTDFATAWTSESAEITAGSNITVTGGSPATISVTTNPTLGLVNSTGLPISTGVSGLGTGIATFLATPTSANLASAVTNETGTGLLVFGTSPTITTPTGIVKGDVGLSLVDNTSDATKKAATLASPVITGHPTVEGVTSTGATGTGKFVFDANPTISGNVAATTFNNVGISSAGSTASLGLGSGKLATISNSLTFNGTDGTTVTFPTTNATIARTDAAQTFTGAQTFSSTIVGSVNGNAGTVTTNANLTGPITSVGNATSIASQTGTGTTFVVNTSPTLVTPTIGAASGTSLSLSGLTASSAVATDGSKNLVSVTNTGSGSNVLATSPTLVTPVLGAATATTINGVTLDNNAWTAYTPSFASSTGTATTAGRYKLIGKSCLYSITFTFTSAITGNVSVGLPFAATSALTQGAAGRELVTSGKIVAGDIAVSASVIENIRFYDNTQLAANTSNFVMNGVYEIA